MPVWKHFTEKSLESKSRGGAHGQSPAGQPGTLRHSPAHRQGALSSQWPRCSKAPSLKAGDRAQEQEQSRFPRKGSPRPPGPALALPALPCCGGYPVPGVCPGRGGGCSWALGGMGGAPRPFSAEGGGGRTWDPGCKMDGCRGGGGPWPEGAGREPGGAWPGGAMPEPVREDDQSAHTASLSDPPRTRRALS